MSDVFDKVHGIPALPFAGIKMTNRMVRGHLVQYCTEEALGCWRNGTRVVKTNSKPGDTHKDGALATVIGSLVVGEIGGYWVEWDDMPEAPVFIEMSRVMAAPKPPASPSDQSAPGDPKPQ